MPEIKKVLVANRGEIAIRVFRTCRKMGIKTVAIYTHADRKAPHVRYADEAYCITDSPADTSYLKQDRIIDIAKKTGAAIHPGYGFYAENAGFRRACDDAGVIFIGPSAEHIDMMGSKTGARAVMAEAGVPTVPGTKNPIRDIEEARKIAREIGYPIMLKAVYGGGGKGMRLVHKEEDFESSFRTASSEALNAFGNGDVYMEKFIIEPHHVEVQVLGDMHGNAIHLFDRECSIQRRHQKVIEESPAILLNDETRAKLHEVAVKATKYLKYEGAGTFEFLADDQQNIYFMEMNTRLQVEHPVSEMVSGIDIVELMIKVAEGEKVPPQEKIKFRGHAIECRITAEDPNTFLPSPGKVTQWMVPGGRNVRVDSHVYTNYVVPPYYDSMIGKLIVWGRDRNKAINIMKRALAEFEVEGIKTTIPFHQKMMENEDFISNNYDTKYLENYKGLEDL